MSSHVRIVTAAEEPTLGLLDRKLDTVQQQNRSMHDRRQQQIGRLTWLVVLTLAMTTIGAVVGLVVLSGGAMYVWKAVLTAFLALCAGAVIAATWLEVMGLWTEHLIRRVVELRRDRDVLVEAVDRLVQIRNDLAPDDDQEQP